LDGRIARLTKTTSDFGLELDSLADFATFGIAPAMLAFSWGLGSFEKTQGSMVHHVTQFGWFATFAFVICGALRLARFNIQSKRPQETAPKRYFVGLPIPAGAGIIAAFVHFFKEPIAQVGSSLLWCGLITLVGVLMISTIRYNSFKELDLKKPRPHIIFLVAALAVSAIFFYSEVALLTLTVTFAASGPVGKLVHFVRRFIRPHVALSDPAHHDGEESRPRIVGLQKESDEALPGKHRARGTIRS
jgi:CDP-diacylglycerol--serine O-phosphatidyltransferase